MHGGIGPYKTGSSPLARGLRHSTYQIVITVRIIPARAGFTPASSASVAASVDHPRSRGVYTTSSTTRTERIGSSPLARGLPYGDLKTEHERRIIPARAGFTYIVATTLNQVADHPRSRGVYAWFL